MAANRISSQNGFLQEFHSYNEAVSWIQRKVLDYKLLPSKCGFPHTFFEEVSEEEHQVHFEQMLADLKQDENLNVLIKTAGRTSQEDGFAYVENGRFAGIGFVPRENDIEQTQDLLDYVRTLNSSVTTNSVIKKVLLEGKYPIQIV